MQMPTFPKVEGGRDFDEEVEDRIRLTHAYNSHIAESNTRALSARGQVKTAEVESAVTLSVQGLDTEKKKKKTETAKKDRAVNDKVMAVMSNAGNSNRLSRHHSVPVPARVKFSMGKHRQTIVKLLL